jgi:uncharacterized protein (DUF58 family)
VRPAAATAAIGFLLAGVAGLFDAEPLWVAAVMLVVLSAGAVLWVWAGARAVTVGRRVGARRVVEGDPVDVELDLRAGGAGLPSGFLEDPLLPEPLALRTGRRRQRQVLRVRFARRGRRALPAPRVVVRDPLGLATATTGRGGSGAELLVLPRVSPVVLAGGTGGEHGAPVTRAGRPRAGAEVDLEGVRALRPGTPASRIHWPALARGGELMERSLRSDTDTRPLVVLDARPGPGAAQGEQDLDAAVRAAASLIVHLARAGGCAALLPGDRRPTIVEAGLVGWDHLHARLAVLDGAAGPGAAARLVDRQGPVLLVSAQRLSRAPRALVQSHAPGRILVVPAPIAGRRASFTVAGCTGYALSEPRVRAGAVMA